MAVYLVLGEFLIKPLAAHAQDLGGGGAVALSEIEGRDHVVPLHQANGILDQPSQGRLAGLLAVHDPVKESTPGAIDVLHKAGIRMVMATGDGRTTALAVARQLGIDEVHGEVRPQDKADLVARLQSEGRRVAMAGDGINDAPALARANVGIAMGTGTDVAIEASDLTLVRGDLRAAVDAIRLSRRTLGTIKGNLFWAFAYNVAALPLAMAGLLNPLIAGAAMAFSSVFVVSNSLRLRRFRAVSVQVAGTATAPDRSSAAAVDAAV